MSRGAWIRGLLLTLVMSSSCGNDDKSVGPTSIFPVHQTEPSWGGARIAYRDVGITCVTSTGAYLTDSSLAGIYLLDRDTGSRSRFRSEGSYPSLTRDGRKIAFSLGGQIMAGSVDSAGVIAITDQGTNILPRWDPTGQFIAFDSDVGDNQGRLFVWVMRADGSERHKVLTQGSGEVRMADWNPSGTILVHIRYPPGVNGASEIYVMDTTGTGVMRLTNNTAMDLYPRFSPQGDRIAFSRQSEGQVPQVWVMNADGSGQHQVTSLGGTLPEWSLDGDSLLYVRENWKMNSSAYGVVAIHSLVAGSEESVTSRHPSQCP